MKDNLRFYKAFGKTPAEAQKTIAAGKLKGMTDINPMWRIKALTEAFGPQGEGWKIEVDDTRVFEAAGESMAHVMVKLYYKKDDGSWSEPIYGIGGSKMAGKGVGDGINDECVDGDCEVLTESGWVPFKYYDGETPIAQYDKHSKQISFVKPINFITKESIDTYKKGDIIMTGGHRILYETAKNQMVVDIAENLCGYRGRAKFDIRYGFFGEPVELTPMQKVGLMLQADGAVYSTNKETGAITWAVSFAKERKIKKALELLDGAGIAVSYKHTSKRNNEKWGDYTQIRFTLDDTDYKTLSKFLPLANYRGLEEEIVFWDGAYSLYINEGYFSWCSTRKDNVDYLQTLFALSGVSSSITLSRNADANKNACYKLYNRLARTRIIPIEEYGLRTSVYCVEVPTTFFLIRKNGNIFVTGNCFKMAYTDAIAIACKGLGMSADIYFSKGRTKYDAAVSASVPDNAAAAQPEAPKFITDPATAEADFAACKSMDELKKLYNEQYGGNAHASKEIKQIVSAALTRLSVA